MKTKTTKLIQEEQLTEVTFFGGDEELLTGEVTFHGGSEEELLAGEVTFH